MGATGTAGGVGSIDFGELDRRVLGCAARAVAEVRPEHLRLPTPCPDWTLHGLLRHMVCDNEGFAVAAREGSASHAQWNGGWLGDDPHAAYERSTGLVTAAFAEALAAHAAGEHDRRIVAREFGSVPVPVAVSMHVVDFLVHGWDVATAIGVPYRPDDDLAEVVLAIMSQFPSDPAMRGPGRAFEVVVPVAADAPAWERLLGLTGRVPN